MAKSDFTGTFGNSGTIQSPLLGPPGPVFRFHRYYREQWYYSTGTIAAPPLSPLYFFLKKWAHILKWFRPPYTCTFEEKKSPGPVSHPSQRVFLQEKHVINTHVTHFRNIRAKRLDMENMSTPTVTSYLRHLTGELRKKPVGNIRGLAENTRQIRQ